MIETAAIRAARARVVAQGLPVAERWKASGGSLETFLERAIPTFLDAIATSPTPMSRQMQKDLIEQAAIAYSEIVARVWGVSIALELTDEVCR